VAGNDFAEASFSAFGVSRCAVAVVVKRQARAVIQLERLRLLRAELALSNT